MEDAYTNHQQSPPSHQPLSDETNKANLSQLGTFSRGKRKVEDMQGVIAEARRTGAH